MQTILVRRLRNSQVCIRDRNNTIVINKGNRDGMEEGNVLAVYKNGGKVDGITLPDSRTGLVMVYRVFDKVSYALVMQTKRPVNLNDFVRNP